MKLTGPWCHWWLWNRLPRLLESNSTWPSWPPWWLLSNWFWPPWLPGNRWPWQLQLMWPPKIHFDATLPPVPRWLSASWHLGTSWDEACCQWLCWHWPEALVGPLREWHFCCCGWWPSASSMLAWDDVLTGGTVPSDSWDGDMVATALLTFSGEDCSDLQLDTSAIAWSRRWVDFCSNTAFWIRGRVVQISCLDDQNLANRQNLGVWFSIGECQSPGRDVHWWWCSYCCLVVLVEWL